MFCGRKGKPDRIVPRLFPPSPVAFHPLHCRQAVAPHESASRAGPSEPGTCLRANPCDQSKKDTSLSVAWMTAIVSVVALADAGRASCRRAPQECTVCRQRALRTPARVARVAPAWREISPFARKTAVATKAPHDVRGDVVLCVHASQDAARRHGLRWTSSRSYRSEDFRQTVDLALVLIRLICLLPGVIRRQ